MNIDEFRGYFRGFMSKLGIDETWGGSTLLQGGGGNGLYKWRVWLVSGGVGRVKASVSCFVGVGPGGEVVAPVDSADFVWVRSPGVVNVFLARRVFDLSDPESCCWLILDWMSKVPEMAWLSGFVKANVQA